MMTMTLKHYNAIEFMESLRKAFTQEQAEILAKKNEEFIADIVEIIDQNQHEAKEFIDNKDLATKSDIRESELRLQKEIEIIRREIEVVRKEIAQANNKTILWLAGIMGSFSIFFVGILAKGFHWF